MWFYEGHNSFSWKYEWKRVGSGYMTRSGVLSAVVFIVVAAAVRY